MLFASFLFGFFALISKPELETEIDLAIVAKLGAIQAGDGPAARDAQRRETVLRWAWRSLLALSFVFLVLAVVLREPSL